MIIGFTDNPEMDNTLASQCRLTAMHLILAGSTVGQPITNESPRNSHIIVALESHAIAFPVNVCWKMSNEFSLIIYTTFAMHFIEIISTIILAVAKEILADEPRSWFDTIDLFTDGTDWLANVCNHEYIPWREVLEGFEETYCNCSHLHRNRPHNRQHRRRISLWEGIACSYNTGDKEDRCPGHRRRSLLLSH